MEQDIGETTVSGLEEAAFKDKVQGGKDVEPAGQPISITSETDRIYTTAPEQVIKILEKGNGRYELTRDMLPDVVVWNPWIEKAKGMADFGPEDGYKKMICVEAGSVSVWNTLEAGDTWEGAQRIKAL